MGDSGQYVPVEPDPTWPEPARRTGLVLLIAVALATFVGLVLWLMLPWFIEECSRLAAWEIVLIWLGDAMGLAWFLWFVVDMRSSIGQAQHRRIWNPWWPVFAIAFGILTDVGMSITNMASERSDFASAVRADALVTGIQCHRATQADMQDSYRIHCRFSGQSGGTHAVVFDVGSQPPFPKPWDWDQPAAAKPAVPPRPLHVAIRYDADRPQRAWTEVSGIVPNWVER